ncbi:MAG: hypothetical protein LUG93_09530 [Lachnospiraceae bacterium]|nr:hypothetical protein [Lachnospiraceae bacterium]
MSKMSELSMLLDDLIACGNRLSETAQALKEFYSAPDEDKPAAPPPEKKKETAPAPAEPAKQYSKEDVRGILARKANEAGGQYKVQVKALVRKYGKGGSLTNVPAESYPDLVKEVEGLTDA